MLSGHEKTVTSVCFQPKSDTVLLSTADDHVLKLWDVREKRATSSVRPCSLVMLQPKR